MKPRKRVGGESRAKAKSIQIKNPDAKTAAKVHRRARGQEIVEVPMSEALSRAVDEGAKRLGITRDEFFVRAIREEMDRGMKGDGKVESGQIAEETKKLALRFIECRKIRIRRDRVAAAISLKKAISTQMDVAESDTDSEHLFNLHAAVVQIIKPFRLVAEEKGGGR